MIKQAAVFAALFLSTWARMPGDEPAPPRDLAVLLGPIRDRFHLPALAAVMVSADAVRARGVVGVRRQGTDQPATLDDRWHLGSVTKSMTATLAARLVEQHRIRWNSTLGEVLPDLAPRMEADWRGVTLEQLLSHRGGAPGNLDADGLWGRLWNLAGTAQEQRLYLVTNLLAHAPAQPPGTRHQYSNAGYTLAGVMLERVGGRAWEDLITREVFLPLGMQHTGFGVPATPRYVNEPWGHRFNEAGDAVPVAPGPEADNPPSIGPGGTVNCTLADLARYLQAHLAGEKGRPGFLTADSFQHLHTDIQGQGYALGWGVVERDWAGGPALQHTGSNTQWYVNVWIAPQRDWACAVLTNIGGEKVFAATDAVVEKLVEASLPKK